MKLSTAPSSDSPPPEPIGKLKLYLIVLIAALGGFLFGYELSLISGAILFLTPEFSLTPTTTGLVVGSATLGCLIGAISGIWIADFKGRRAALFLAGMLFIASGVGCALATQVTVFVLWRIVGGIGVGLSAAISPMYIAEIAPVHLRARLVTLNQLAIVLGKLMSILATWLLSFGGHWRWMFASQIVPVLPLAIGILLVPESPRWLAAAGRIKDSLNVLARINGPAQAHKLIEEIQDNLRADTGSFRELFQPGLRLALFIAVTLMIFSQINGVNMILIYTPTMFLEAGLSQAKDAILNSILIYSWILLNTLGAFWLTKRFGRRPILIGGTIAMSIGHLLMFVSFTYHLSPLLTLLAILVPTGAFTLTLAPVSWIVLSEIFPNRIRGKAMSLATGIMFTTSFIVVSVFPGIMSWFKGHFGQPGPTFLIFSAVCLCCSLFVWRILPETRGKTLEEIGSTWLKRQPAKQRELSATGVSGD